ncbi:MAG TPA: FtsW/RodA/SpoVE family cell cycle protein [Pirellulales bacterium]|nr:FtsW/RodA/SpoVE family cell cycle protein [Pirellulales bacterium]
MAARVCWNRFPWPILGAGFGLLLLGLLGISRSEELAGGESHYARRQMAWACLAGVALAATLGPSYRLYARRAYLLFAAVLGLLVAVYFLPTVHGTHRWIRLGGISLQPSEFAKVAYVLALSRWLTYRENYSRFRDLLVPLVLTLVPVVLVLREPDLGTAMVFLPVLFVMLFASGARVADLAKLALCGLVCLPLLWTQMSHEQRSRVSALFSQNRPAEMPSDDGYHLHQAKQLLALGGIWGSLLAGEPTDDPAAYRLPEDHTDFIFIVICERLGWAGAASVLGLVLVVCWRGLVVARRTREPFGRLAAVGVVGLFAVQTLINTAMTVGLLPITGLSLPLVSYGGSGLLAHAAALGILFNIAVRPGYEVGGEPFGRSALRLRPASGIASHPL